MDTLLLTTIIQPVVLVVALGKVAGTCTHGYSSSHTLSSTCGSCSGSGTISTRPCVHGVSSSHRYCSHYTNTSLTSHSYCSHNRTSQHDN